MITTYPETSTTIDIKINTAKLSDLLESYDRSKLYPFQFVHDDGKRCAVGVAALYGRGDFVNLHEWGLNSEETIALQTKFDEPARKFINTYFPNQANRSGGPTFSQLLRIMNEDVQRSIVDECVKNAVSYLRSIEK